MMTSSPGLMTASRLAIIASVAPHVTVILRSGSHSSPLYARAFSAIALRKFGEPCVIAYWLYSSSIARLAASLITAGAGKSGNPCARLTAPVLSARRVISRITDSVKNLVFVDTSVAMARTVYAGNRTSANYARRPTTNGRIAEKERILFDAKRRVRLRSFVLGSVGKVSDFCAENTLLRDPTVPDRARDSSDSFPPHGPLVPHVTLTQLFHLLRTLLQPPLIDSLDIEAPVAADLETGQLALLQQAVNGGTMHAEIFRELAYGKNLRITQHLNLVLF